MGTLFTDNPLTRQNAYIKNTNKSIEQQLTIWVLLLFIREMKYSPVHIRHGFNEAIH